MVVGNGYGYGYGEEGGGPIIEQTSSSESHYELMALARLIADGLGVTDSEGEPPYLQQIRDGLAAIKGILQQSHDASEALRAEAQKVLEAHVESAQQYMQAVDQPMPPDFDPFVTMPAGTVVRDLPDGGRLFTLADGVMVRVGPDGRLTAIGMDGSVARLEPARGGVVTLPDGRELTLKPEAVRVTHEAAGIEGLPLDIDPNQTAQGRYRIELPGGYRLDVFQSERTAMIGNPAGTSVVLGVSRIEGVGEDIEVRLVPGGAKGFTAMESGHKGVIEADGTIHVAMANGLNLVIHFPDDDGSNVDPDSGHSPGSICEERD